MAALGTSAPEGSVTIPDRVAPETWAWTSRDPATANMNRSMHTARPNGTIAFKLYVLVDFMALLEIKVQNMLVDHESCRIGLQEADSSAEMDHESQRIIRLNSHSSQYLWHQQVDIRT